MPTVDFYVLGDPGTDAQYRFACRLAEKAFDAGTRIFLRTPSLTESKALDDLLWTFSDRTFLPHEILGATPSPHPLVAVLIGHERAPEGYRGLLINVASDLPADADAFDRIAEVVAADPDRKQQARARFKQYRDRGWTLETHTVA